MRPEFIDNIGGFLNRLKRDSERFANNAPFEDLMKGLSDGSIDFRWSFGGRLRKHRDEETPPKPDKIWLRWLASAPFIYGMVVPILALDISVSVYQAICFRLWNVTTLNIWRSGKS